MITCQFESGNKAKLRHVVAGALIEKSGQLLLVKRAADTTEGGKYSWPGGYLEQEETIAQGLLREVKEETGYEGKIISLFSINDNPQRDMGNVDFIFLVKPLKKIGKHDKEISSIHWFALDKLPPKNQIAFDHAKTIQLYLRWRKEKFKLPVTQG